MSKMYAICGLDCSVCPAYQVTLKDDPELRRKTAAEWAKAFNADIKPEDVYCVGCTVKEGKHIGHCGVCEVRLCGLAKGVKTCADCDDYGCAKIEAFFKFAPQVKETLEELRRQRK